jgi:hypothetical protein
MMRQHTNRDLIIRVARGLGPLRERVTFVGGSVIGLLITDEAAPAVRPTMDVDIIVEVASTGEYYRFAEELRRLGFTEDRSKEAPICRWLIGGTRVDVLPTDEQVIGFSNRWYRFAASSAERCKLEEDLTIRLITAPCLLATKLESFLGRGLGDFTASHDMEDIIALIDGRKELVEEIRNSHGDVRTFLAETFRSFVVQEAFQESLPGHLPPDHASQARLPMLRTRIEVIASMK